MPDPDRAHRGRPRGGPQRRPAGVSTNEALLERRLAEIPTSEWADLSIDITPREMCSII